MINIRKLAALDMVLNGTRFIQVEFALGVILPLLLGQFSFRSGLASMSRLNWMTVTGIWLLGIGVNYLPLFIYSVIIARGRTVKEEGEPMRPQLKKYGFQQVIILVPLFVVVVALVQEARGAKKQ